MGRFQFPEKISLKEKLKAFIPMCAFQAKRERNGIFFMNIEIQTMTLEDLETIKDILTSDFDDFWNFNVFKEELQNENSKYLVAKIGNEIIGFAGIKIILDQADIMNIVIKKIYRKQGVRNITIAKFNRFMQISWFSLYFSGS